jgi:hypothetical protein
MPTWPWVIVLLLLGATAAVVLLWHFGLIVLADRIEPEPNSEAAPAGEPKPKDPPRRTGRPISPGTAPPPALAGHPIGQLTASDTQPSHHPDPEPSSAAPPAGSGAPSRHTKGSTKPPPAQAAWSTSSERVAKDGDE